MLPYSLYVFLLVAIFFSIPAVFLNVFGGLEFSNVIVGFASLPFAVACAFVVNFTTKNFPANIISKVLTYAFISAFPASSIFFVVNETHREGQSFGLFCLVFLVTTLLLAIRKMTMRR